MRNFISRFFILLLIAFIAQETLAQKRIYIAPDDHTDYMWKGNEQQYQSAFLEMTDYYLNQMDATAGSPSPFQARWNADGSFWMWTYQKNRTQAQFQRLINRIKDGHFSMPLNALVLSNGGTPAEAVLRGMGTASNTAIQKYMNQKKVPQLFVATGASKWGDPKNFPWTMGWQPTYSAEGRIYAQHILETKPNAKIGVLMQNDDYGKDYYHGFLEGLSDKAKSMIVSHVTYEVTDATIDSQIVSLKASGADVFFNITTPKFAAQAIKKVAELGWKPVHYLNNVSATVGSVLVPAGLDNATGVITTQYLKDPTDPQWANDKGFKDWLEWMKEYNASAELKDANYVYGYNVAQGLMQVLKQAGDNLTRENVMKQAASLDMTLPMLLPRDSTAPSSLRRANDGWSRPRRRCCRPLRWVRCWMTTRRCRLISSLRACSPRWMEAKQLPSAMNWDRWCGCTSDQVSKPFPMSYGKRSRN